MKKELSMEARLLIAFVLMGLVLFVTPYFYKPTPPAPPATKSTATKTEEATLPMLSSDKPAPLKEQASEPIAMPGQIQGDKEETISVETDHCRVVFSNRGAVARSWVLKEFKDHTGHPLDLVNQVALDKVPAPFALVFKGQPPPVDPNTALFRVERSDGGLNLSFEFSDGRTDTKKTFRFAPKSYLVEVTSQVTQNGVLLPHSLEWRGGFGDSTANTPATIQHALYYDLANSKLHVEDPKTAKNGPVSTTGRYSFAGLEDSFFAGVFLPGNRASVEMTVFSDPIPKDKEENKDKEEARIGAAVGGDGFNEFALYVGPKDTEILKRVDPKLEQVVDWGWFEFIAKPLFLALNWTADRVGHNYGWAIILVTIAINTVLFPLKMTSMKSSKKMQVLQPQIAAINARYKGLSLNDPKKAEQNAEVMELYKKHGVNPVGGCLPMVLQLPFFFAFYKVLNVAIQLRGANWLWVPDLSQMETLSIHLLPVLLVVTQFLSQRMTPSPGMDPSQQKMMMFMPLVMGFMFYYQSAGLVLYWLTGNLVGIAQQWFLNRSTPPPAPVVVDVKPAPKKKGRN